jgi:MoaA/NifB/PqqE/SkfB family radical SAM enzyme
MTSRTGVETIISRAIAASLPLGARIPPRALVRLVPPLPVAPSTGCRDLRELAERNVTFLSFLKHLSRCRDGDLVRGRVRSYIVNPTIASHRARKAAMRRHGFGGIGALVLTPSVECNLDCALCYNKCHTDPEVRLSLETMDRVVKQAVELGAARVSVVGGEPLMRWRDVHALAEANPGVLFTVMTNGTLLTPEIAHAFTALPNVELSFSIDGFRETNDRLRGRGTYDLVTSAMRLYRDVGGMVVYSPTITRESYREVLSDKFIDTMIANGAYMAYHHHYYLVGGQDRADLLLGAEERRWISRRIREVTTTRPLIVFDNLLSGLFRGGCHAVREYVHVNHRGGVEPCCMVPFAHGSVHDAPLAEILRSGFFSALRSMPADGSGIRRCLVGGSCLAFRDVVERESAVPSSPRSFEVFAGDRVARRAEMPTCFSADAAV